MPLSNDLSEMDLVMPFSCSKTTLLTPYYPKENANPWMAHEALPTWLHLLARPHLRPFSLLCPTFWSPWRDRIFPSLRLCSGSCGAHRMEHTRRSHDAVQTEVYTGYWRSLGLRTLFRWLNSWVPDSSLVKWGYPLCEVWWGLKEKIYIDYLAQSLTQRRYSKKIRSLLCGYVVLSFLCRRWFQAWRSPVGGFSFRAPRSTCNCSVGNRNNGAGGAQGKGEEGVWS